MSQPGVEVLLVGPRSSAILNKLEEALQQDGWATVRIVAPGDLACRIGARHKAVVVVRTSQAQQALDVLEELEPKRHSSMVIVVVDRAEPGEYYCLTQAGATAYFEVGEDPALIVQGVEWAAHVLAP
jgi:DNA-binding NtrC family response regulator